MALVNSKPLGHGVYVHPTEGSSNSNHKSSSTSSISSVFEQINLNQERLLLQQQEQQQRQPHKDLFKRHTLLHLLWQQLKQQHISPPQWQRLCRAACAADAAAASADTATARDTAPAAAATAAATRQQGEMQQHQFNWGQLLAPHQEPLLPPRLPAIFRNNTGPVAVAGARVCLCAVAAAAALLVSWADEQPV